MSLKSKKDGEVDERDGEDDQATDDALHQDKALVLHLGYIKVTLLIVRQCSLGHNYYGDAQNESLWMIWVSFIECQLFRKVVPLERRDALEKQESKEARYSK